MECGKRIRALREASKITQTALASAVGTCAANVSRLEAGEHSPRLELLQRIARFFGKSLDYVAGGDGFENHVPSETARVLELARKAGESATLASYFEYLARRRERQPQDDFPAAYANFPRGLPYMTTAEVAALFSKFGGDILPRMACLDSPGVERIKTEVGRILDQLELNKKSQTPRD